MINESKVESLASTRITMNDISLLSDFNGIFNINDLVSDSYYQVWIFEVFCLTLKVAIQYVSKIKIMSSNLLGN